VGGLAVSALGGALCAWIGTPLPWMIGAIFAMGGAQLAGARFAALPGGREAGFVVVGANLGLYFTAPVVHEVASLWPWFVGLGLAAIAYGTLSAWVLAKLSGTDRATAFFGCMPGGAAEMATLGEKYGAASDRVARAHSLRMLMVVTIFPVAITLAVTLWIANVIEGRLQKAEHLQASTRAVMGKFVRAMAVLLGILVALPLVGVDVTALSVFGGAIGVGLGFGMQKIASNYVSGFIILLDRSVRIGDLVTVDGRQGTVQEIASRYTVVKAGDGTEQIIPNETLITQSVTNHTYSNKRAVVKVTASVPYDVDMDLALGILAEAGQKHPFALRDPAPAAVILKIGDPGVDLELSIWIDDVFANAAQIASFVHVATHATFRQDNPMFSSFKLSDGYVTALDLFSMNCQTNLVTLSSCKSGLSEVSGGDDLLGLMRGFLYAGARSLILSLWSVSDESTVMLMTEFYKQWQSGSSKTRSLQSAMRSVRAAYPNPFFWAPFILVGKV